LFHYLELERRVELIGRNGIGPAEAAQGEAAPSCGPMRARRRSMQEADKWRTVIQRTGCILWSAEITPRKRPDHEPDADQADFDWQTTILDEGVAQRVLPLKVPPGQTYLNAWWNCIAPDARLRMREIMRRAILKSFESYRVEFSCVDKAGREVWLNESAVVERVGEGRWHVFAICTDITERKQLEESLRQTRCDLERQVEERTKNLQAAVEKLAQTQEALRASEAKYRGLAENTQDILYSMDSQGTLTYVGPQTARYGWKPEDLVDRHFLNVVAAEDRERVACEFESAVTKGTARTIEFRVRDGNGRLHWFEEAGTPQMDAQGRVIGVTGVLRDVTERRVVEQALIESENRFRSVYEQSPIGIYRTTPEGKILLANPAIVRMLGYESFEELSMRNLEEAGFLQGYPRQRFKELMERNGVVQGFEAAWTTKDGRPVVVEENARAIRGPDGRILYYDGTAENITARKKAEDLCTEQQTRLHRLAERLATAQDAEQRRIGEGLHDDVAQLLTAAGLKLAVARSSEDSSESTAILVEVEGLIRTVNERIRSLSFELTSSTLHKLGLQNAVHEICASLRDRYGVRVGVQSDLKDMPLNETTATVVFKSIHELLFNVVKHAGVKQASISIGKDGDDLKIVVEDHGKGFPMSVSQEELGAGKGLGLFGIRERLKDIAGRMKIESQPGAGTQVTLWAPLGKRKRSSRRGS
jgi:PAS domain S-box-containing protein